MLAHICANKSPVGLHWNPVESSGVQWSPVESSGVQWGTVESYRNRGGRVKPSIYYISNVVVHKFCVFNIVNIICFTGPAEGLHYNIVFQHILCIRNTVNVVLRLSSGGVQFIFFRTCGWTN